MSSLDKRLLASASPRWGKSGQIVGVLDLGATKIACLIARSGDPSSGFELMGHGQQSCRGLKAGKVIDMDGLERSIRLAVEDAERMAGQQISSVRMAINGPSTSTRHVKTSIEMGGREVTQKDVQKLLDKALQEGECEKHQILHAIPFSYVIDGSDGVRDPRGMFADKLGVVMTLVTVPTPIYKNLVLCVSRAHLQVESVSCGSVMSAESVLLEDEVDNGAICIDMGGGSTGVSVYLNGTLAFLENLPVGGQHVTSDIAQGIGTTFPAAERIKTLHGTLVHADADNSDMIETPKIGDDGRLQSTRMPKAKLTEVIEPRVEEVFELISKSLSASGLGGRLPRRAVLTGGASELPGMRELASRVLAMPVRLGRPAKANQLGEECQKPTFSTASGLLTFDHVRGGDPKSKRKNGKHAADRKSASGSFGQVFQWFKENF